MTIPFLWVENDISHNTCWKLCVFYGDVNKICRHDPSIIKCCHSLGF
jgi:hypothetical protein